MVRLSPESSKHSRRKAEENVALEIEVVGSNPIRPPKKTMGR
jgi:hypothetical protein